MDKRVIILVGAVVVSIGIIVSALVVNKRVKDTVKNLEALDAALNQESNYVEPVEEIAQEVEEEPQIDPNSPEGRALALGLPKPPDVDINSWELILVNTSNTIDEAFVPNLKKATCKASSTDQDERIADILSSYAKGAEDAGLIVYLSSGYRSYSQQAANLQRKLNQGYSYEAAVTVVQPPGCSEHQTGLCCDITDIYRASKSPAELELTPTYQWLYANCADYGFILRYPDGKSDITGIMYEPWHFRYVGVDAAKYIMENGLCLEEFIALYV